MKNLTKLTALVAIICLVGCASSNVATVAYKVDGVTIHAIDTGMKVYADLVVAGKASQPIQDSVKASHNIYRVAMKAQIAATQAYLAIKNVSTATVGDVEAAKAEANRRLVAASNAIANLIIYLTDAGVPANVLPK